MPKASASFVKWVVEDEIQKVALAVLEGSQWPIKVTGIIGARQALMLSLWGC